MSAEELARSLGARASAIDARTLVPMLCERAEASERVLGRAGWLFELKLDGARILADKQGDRVRLFYRKLREATESYGEIAAALATLAESRVVLDGEVVAFDEKGRPDFQRLGHRIQTKGNARSAVRVPVVYVVFDVLAVGPWDVRALPLEARKEILARIVPDDGLAGGLVRRHTTFDDGVALFRLCREHRLEGVVAKRLGSPYKAGERSFDWLKIKRELEAEFVVIGWTEGEGDRARLGALDLGAYEGDRLVFRGRVGSGLHGTIIDELLAMLEPLEVPHPVAEGKYSPKPRRHHCRPEIVVSVRYGGWSLDPSGARYLRFPVFRGIRPDVSPKDCTAGPEDGADVRVVGGSGAEEEPRAAAARRERSERPARRIHVTAPSRAILPDGTTKGALCDYFEAVAPALLRYARGRVCTLSSPEGKALWPPPKWMPSFTRTVVLASGGREVRGFVVDSVDVLLFAVEAGCPCIEHGPLLEDRPEHVDFVAVRVTAPEREDRVRGVRALRALANEIGLPAAAIASGARSIDVLVGLGSAPASAAAPLGALLAQLAADAGGSRARMTPVDGVPLAFGPCARGSSDRTVAAVPIGWDELDALDPAAVGLEAARARAASGAADRDAIAGVTVDVGAAVAAIERIVAARGSGR